MTKDEALKMALEALHGFIPYLPLNDEAQCGRYDEALTAIKEALANEALEKMAENARELGLDYEPEQEPVAFASHGVVNWIADKQFRHEALLYSAQQRTWVGLTDEEREQVINANTATGLWHMAKAIEAKLKEKNT